MKDGKDVIARLRNQIKSPMTLREIIEEYKQADYSAEMLLQHLLLWVANNQQEQQ